MTTLPENIEQMLVRLMENSKTELEIVRALADGIRNVDEQMLREVRNVAFQHDVRREAIFGELQELASRLCVLPSRNVMTAISKRATPRTAIEGTAAALNGEGRTAYISGEGRNTQTGGEGRNTQIGGDWRKAAQKIDEELSELLHADGSRH